MPPIWQQDIMMWAQQQWLDPKILEMAMQATNWWTQEMQWIPPEMMGQTQPQGGILWQWGPEDLFGWSQLSIHADEMAPMLQQATQDEILFFIKKIIDLYLNIG